MKKDDLERLATAPVGRLLWQYSLPAVVGMLVMALYNVVDRVFIGQVVGPEAIAGMALTFPLMNIATAVGVLVGVGASTRISIHMGRGDRPGAALLLGNAATLTVLNGVVYLSCFAIWLTPLLRLFGAGDNTIGPAYEYMSWVLPGLLLTNVAFGLNNVLRATGYPDRAMFTMIIGAIVNVVLDAVFVLWLGWGMKGAALATDIAMACSAWFVLAHFFRHDVNLAFTRGTFRLRLTPVMSMIALGAAPAIINLASCLVNALINRSLAQHGAALTSQGGDLAIGAAGIFVTVTSLATTIVLGVCMGLQPIIGYNYGAGRFGRLSRAFWLATGAGTMVCVLSMALGLLFPAGVARVFTSDPLLIDCTVTCLRNSLWAFGIVAFPIVTTTFFQSIGAPARAMIMSLVRQVIFLIPLMLWLPNRLGVEGVWLSFPLCDLLASLVAAAMLIPAFRAIRRSATLKDC